MIDITPADQEIVTTILKKHVPNAEIRVFGSRHKWTSKPYSDLDLAIVADAKLDKQIIYDLEEAFEESELSFRVDIIDWYAISDEFRAIIEQGYTVIQEKKEPLPAGWVMKKLGELCESISETYKFENRSKIIFLNTSDILNGKFLHSHYSDINSLPGQAKKKIKKEDILYSEIRPKNRRFAFVNIPNSDEYVVSTKLMVLRVKGTLIDAKFLYLLLTSEGILDEFQAIAESRSGTFPQITFDTISNQLFKIPPLDEQKEIAAILSSLDDKIELNQQINKKLEEMAQAIFKEWFIDFNFPDENGNPYRDSGGAMIDSELGQIPASWSVGKLGDYVNIVGGATPSTKNTIFWENGTIYWATPKDLSVNKDVFLKDTLRKITTEGLKEISSGLLAPKTLLLSSRAPIGYLALSNISLAINQGYIAILPSSKYDNAFLYVWLKNNMDKVLAMANGSTFQEISKKSFKMIKILNYPRKLVEQYTNIINPLFEQINILEIEITNLNNLRNTLLPKLISSELGITYHEN